MRKKIKVKEKKKVKPREDLNIRVKELTPEEIEQRKLEAEKEKLRQKVAARDPELTTTTRMKHVGEHRPDRRQQQVFGRLERESKPTAAQLSRNRSRGRGRK